MNRATSPYTAIIDGQSTGLAGCANANCQMSCLRKCEILKLREAFAPSKAGICNTFIPNK